MPQTILEMAKDLVMAQIEAGHVHPDDMQRALQQTFTRLSELKMQEEAGTIGTVAGDGKAPAPVDWKNSITRHTVTCLECGAVFKQLSSRHLREHGMDARDYRAKYGIPRTQPLSAKATTARRKRIVQAIRPWEKTPRYREAQERTAAQAQAAAPAKKKRTRQAPRRQA
jgi:predicted transcriptional regulator